MLVALRTVKCKIGVNQYERPYHTAIVSLPNLLYFAGLDSPQWAALDAFEVKLIIDLAAQYTG
jgi:hypothetical protein